MSDPIHHPDHYAAGGLEVIDILRKKLTPEQFEGYLLGNVLKYLLRYRLKDNPVSDLNKADVYLGWLTDSVRGREFAAGHLREQLVPFQEEYKRRHKGETE